MDHRCGILDDDLMEKIIEEVRQGREVAQQLLIQLNIPSSTREAREFLVQKILISYDNLLSMLKHYSTTITTVVPTNTNPQRTIATSTGAGAVMSESPPRSFSGSEDSDNKSESSRKRKAMPRWTKQVQVRPGAGLEGPLDDGFSWRKYGQKDILGAKFPRGYYRCTNRHVQGCLATKQVQRSDHDPTIFEITYRGRHTCSLANSNTVIFTPEPTPTPQVPTTNTLTTAFLDQPQHSQDVLLSFKTDLKVTTHNLDTQDKQQTLLISTPNTTSFYHLPPASTSNNSNDVDVQSTYSFAHYYNMLEEDNSTTTFGGIVTSPSFVSPATSASNYDFSALAHDHSNNMMMMMMSSSSSSFGGTSHNLVASDSQVLTDIVSSAPTSATNSPTVGAANLAFGQLESNSNHFTFDNAGFFF